MKAVWPSCKVLNNEAVGLLIQYYLSLVHEYTVGLLIQYNLSLVHEYNVAKL